MTNNQETIEAYNRSVRAYVKGSHASMAPPVAEWLEQALKYKNKLAKILEIGSGHGKDAKYLIEQGYAIECTDASTGFVDYLNSINIPAHELNILTDELKDSYDVIFADMVFLHFNHEEFLSAAKKCVEALTPNGRLALAMKEGVGEDVKTQKISSPRYFKYWKLDELKLAFQDLGLKVTFTNQVPDDRSDRPDMIYIVGEKS